MQFKIKEQPIVAWRVSELLSFAGHNWNLLPKFIVDSYENGNIVFANKEMLVNHEVAQFTDWILHLDNTISIMNDTTFRALTGLPQIHYG